MEINTYIRARKTYSIFKRILDVVLGLRGHVQFAGDSAPGCGDQSCGAILSRQTQMADEDAPGRMEARSVRWWMQKLRQLV